jgi:hypothetical protein
VKAKIAIESLLGANLAKLTLLSIGRVSKSAPLPSRSLISFSEVVTRMAPDEADDMSRVSTVPSVVIRRVPLRASLN